jgi:predicted secreted protein
MDKKLPAMWPDQAVAPAAASTSTNNNDNKSSTGFAFPPSTPRYGQRQSLIMTPQQLVMYGASAQRSHDINMAVISMLDKIISELSKIRSDASKTEHDTRQWFLGYTSHPVPVTPQQLAVYEASAQRSHEIKKDLIGALVKINGELCKILSEVSKTEHDARQFIAGCTSLPMMTPQQLAVYEASAQHSHKIKKDLIGALVKITGELSKIRSDASKTEHDARQCFLGYASRPAVTYGSE